MPPDERIFLQVGHVIERRQRVKLEHQPAHVSVKKSLGDAVGVFIVIDMLMVSAVLAGPEEHGVFKGTGTEDQCQQPHDPVRLKSKVRIQPVIAKCDRKSACEKHHREEPDLEPINPEEPDISGHRSER